MKGEQKDNPDTNQIYFVNFNSFEAQKHENLCMSLW